MKKVTINLNDILDLINSARDYGFGRDVFYVTLFDWIPKLTDQDLVNYSNSFLTPEARSHGYGEEDAECALEQLRELRDRYQTHKVVDAD